MGSSIWKRFRETAIEHLFERIRLKIDAQYVILYTWDGPHTRYSGRLLADNRWTGGAERKKVVDRGSGPARRL
jgi:hypothetical protein